MSRQALLLLLLLPMCATKRAPAVSGFYSAQQSSPHDVAKVVVLHLLLLLPADVLLRLLVLFHGLRPLQLRLLHAHGLHLLQTPLVLRRQLLNLCTRTHTHTHTRLVKVLFVTDLANT